MKLKYRYSIPAIVVLGSLHNVAVFYKIDPLCIAMFVPISFSIGALLEAIS